MRTLILILIFYSFYSGISHSSKQESSPVASNNYIDPFAMINEGQTLLKEGDLVVRLNQDRTSQFIRNLNRHDKKYSHAGVVLYERGDPFIYHIVIDDENPDGKLRKDSLSKFCNPRKNIAYGIFRYEMALGEIETFKKLLHVWYNKEVRFDLEFNMRTDNKMYCSEMIMKALAISTGKRILIETTKLTSKEAGLFSTYLRLPFTYTRKLRVVPIDNLYTNTNCHLIKEYNYKMHR